MAIFSAIFSGAVRRLDYRVLRIKDIIKANGRG